MGAPALEGLQVLWLGSVLGQPRSGVVRHAEEVLPRAAAALAAQGGRLWVLGPAETPTWLAACAQRSHGALRIQPADLGSTPAQRWRREGPAIQALQSTHSGPWLLHSGHLPLPRGLPEDLPVTWMLHDTRQLDRRLVGPWRALLARRVYATAAQRADAIVVPSRTVGALLARHSCNAAEKLHVARHGSEHFTPLPRREPQYLLGLGHLEKRKNWELLLSALSLEPRLPTLKLCGHATNGEGERLTARAVQLGVQGRFEILPPAEESELPELFASAAALVLPSRMEGFGLPVIEAFKAGLPVALARAGALPEIGGPHATSFDPDSPAEAAHALLSALARGPRELEAAQRYATGFHWDHATRELLRAWERARGAHLDTAS